jgi:phage N-6-adenine-methyltransferase
MIGKDYDTELWNTKGRERKLKMANLDPLMSSARTGELDRNEWQTPSWLYQLLDKEFYFDLDPAATAENALTARYFTKEMNGLAKEWHGTAFVNPPYSQLFRWVKKAYEEADTGRATVVILIPARTDTRAWWQYVRWGDVRFLPGRLKFGMSEVEKEKLALKNIERIAAGKKPLSPDNSAPFPSAIVVFEKNFSGSGQRPTTFYWDVSMKHGGGSSSAGSI